ncbi:MAG: Sir2 family NAD-dependent protein deacetylase [Thermoplasmatota archaeon]
MPMIIPDDVMSQARKAAEVLAPRLPAMVVTGAGISVESNIPPFRGPNGLWERYDPYEYGHIDTFIKDPYRTWKMLREIIDGSINAEPNEAHLAISRMEERGWVRPVVTQNVDGLHALAGTRDLLEVHGNARSIYCPGCGRKEAIDRTSWPRFRIDCTCGSVKRPDIVFFGEQLPEKEIQMAFQKAYEGVDLIVVGTSGLIHPVAMIPGVAKSQGGRIVEVNTERGEGSMVNADVLVRSVATVGLRALEMALAEIIGVEMDNHSP